jgi:hypothetical protein
MSYSKGERKKGALSSTVTSRVENYDEGLGPSDVYQRRDCDEVWIGIRGNTNAAITL